MKNTNLIKKFLSVIFSVIFMACSIFLCSCDDKYSSGRFWEDDTEWVSDEMTIKTDGKNHYVFGTFTTETQSIEVLIDVRSFVWYMNVYNAADFGEEFINEIKQDQKNGEISYEICRKIEEYMCVDAGDNFIKCIFSGSYSYKCSFNERVEFIIDTDNYSETIGQESRVGETWVLIRHDLSEE